jgi:hypothetical protein
VCTNCHGVEYSLSALSDVELVQNNFNAPPKKDVPSLEMVRERRRANH